MTGQCDTLSPPNYESIWFLGSISGFRLFDRHTHHFNIIFWTRWIHLHHLQIWPQGCVTCIARLPCTAQTIFQGAGLLSPLCTIFTCFFTVSSDENNPSHSWHLYLSPSCIFLIWWSRRSLLLYFCWQMLQSNVIPSCFTKIWCFKVVFEAALNWQLSQLKRSPLCLISICRFSPSFALNTCLHNSQLYVTPKG